MHNPYMLYPNTQHMFRFMHASVDMSPITKRMHLARRKCIMSPIDTGKKPGVFERETK